MKIVFINGYSNNRGAETYVRELSSRLTVSNQVDVLKGSKKNMVRWPILWRFYLDPHGIYTFTFTLKRLFRIWKNKYDIVIPINGGWQPALVRLITWVYGGKMIISGQSGIGWDDRNNLWCFPDYFLALSTKALDWAKKVNPFIKVVYIPNGVDIDFFNPKGYKYKPKVKTPFILCVAALERAKRIDLAIRAVAKLKKISLLVVGDGKLKKETILLGTKLLGERFELISAKFEDMPGIYRSAKLFTLPSQSYQSFEIVIVEAMATNLPVVVNDDPIRREIVAEAGLLVDPVNLENYAKTIEQALNLDWGNKPKIQAEKFSWDNIAHQYEKLLKNI